MPTRNNRLPVFALDDLLPQAVTLARRLLAFNASVSSATASNLNAGARAAAMQGLHAFACRRRIGQ